MTAMFAQGELFPTGIVHEPTIAERRGDTYVSQCAHCGLLICAAFRFGPAAACPACAHTTWRRQAVATGPFRLAADPVHGYDTPPAASDRVADDLGRALLELMGLDRHAGARATAEANRRAEHAIAAWEEAR